MPEKIAKYQILERIGRGGMGMIFKAHDPMLDRSVALKVISSEIEVTDELRARFFREAQACARLSHPNIITIYDMGEDAGRLYIVMEFLDGDELRHFITSRKMLPLEDKLSIMVQVCDGLHYAHQNGIVHRDIKPGNIFLLRNGQLKILDFGIAQIANSERGLTRTGLIMGTLRYISPEQVRGRADYRSDIFSVGAVFYELLSLRPPFTGDDPMQLLEQLRTEDPPPLNELDPAIPADLAAIVARALRKDPAARFTDLAQMRTQLDQVQLELVEEAHRVRARVIAQRERLRQLQAALAERTGPPKEVPAIPAVGERERLTTLQALEHELAGRMEALQAQIARANALAPAFQHAQELLEAGMLADAVQELEAIVAEMPEHAHALESLARARGLAEVERRRQLAARLVTDAQAALAERDYTLCLELLAQAAEIPLEEARPEIAALRQAAEAGREQQETARRARQQAERAREEMAQAHRSAQAGALAAYAPELWDEAEARATEATAAFEREAHDEAGQGFMAAAEAYQRFQETALDAQRREREGTERAREQAAQARERAAEARAHQYAHAPWNAAETRLAAAQAAIDARAIGRAGAIFDEASALYGHAQSAAVDARREREHAESAREQAGQARGTAQAQAALQYAPALWNDAETRFSGGQAAFAREAYGQAGSAFEAAAVAYRQAEETARDARQREREAVDVARTQAARSRERAEAARAVRYARELWEAAETKLAEAQASYGAQALGRATEVFDEASGLYGRAEEVARETRQRDRRRAEEARHRTEQAQRAAEAADAQQHTVALWSQAATRVTDAGSALVLEHYAEAAEAFDEAHTLYRQAEHEAREARRRERERAERSRQTMAAHHRDALAADGASHAPADWAEAEASAAAGEAAFAGAGYAEASRSFDQAAALYRRTEERAREVIRARDRARADAEKAQKAMAQARRGAEQAQASRYAAEQWLAGESAEAQATAALNRQEHAAARPLFAEARRLYTSAGQTAAVAAEAESRRVDAMMRDARRLLKSGDVPGCLRRLGEVVALRPGDAAAEALRRQAEGEQSEVDAAPPPRIPIDEVTVVREHPPERMLETVFQTPAPTEQSPGASILTPPAVEHGEPPSEGFAPAEAPTVLADRAMLADRTQLADRTELADRAELAKTPGVAGDALPPAWMPRRRLPLIGIGVGAAAVVVGLAVYWQTSTVTPVPPRPPAQAPTAQAPRAPAPTAPAPRAQAPTAPVPTPSQPPAPSQPTPGRVEAEAVRKQVVAGREAAVSAGAERFAASTFKAAREHERAAETAIQQREWDTARSRYSEALASYGAAATEAAKASALAQRETEAQRSREQVTAAQRAADAAGAAQLAKARWARAGNSQRGAEAALKRGEFDQAEKLFKESATAYRDAEKEATEQKRAEAERSQLAAAKQKAAEEAAAAAIARQNAERAAEAERQAALARQRQQQEAEAERQATLARQRQRDAEQAAARRATDEMRAKAHADRDQAVKAGADTLAKDLFAAAAAKEGEGERLVAGQNLGGATQAYRTAAEGYTEATRRAKVLQEAKAGADQARARMTAEKQRARQEASEFNAAVAQERQGAQSYERLAFKEASESFAAATALFAKAAARPPERPPQRPAPADEVRGVLDSYVRAFETKDLALMQKVRPGLKPDEVRKLQESFDQSKEYRLTLKVDSLDVTGDQAVVKGRREDSLVSKGGQSFRNEASFTFRLKRSGDSWIIDAVR